MPPLLQLRAVHLHARSLQVSDILSKTLHPTTRPLNHNSAGQQYRILLTSTRGAVNLTATSQSSRLPPSPLHRRPSLPNPAIMDRIQTRSHAGHSHKHTHGENVYLTSTNKKDAGVHITRIGLYVNLGMAIGKGIGGYVFHSQALIADAFHALTDLVSDFMTLATVSWSLKPPNQRFPTGYGKIESLGALGVSGLLLCGGAFMGLNASEVLYAQFFMDAAHAAEHSHGLFGHSHGSGVEHLGPNINAAWLAAGSIVVKEWLYRASAFVSSLPSVSHRWRTVTDRFLCLQQ